MIITKLYGGLGNQLFNYAVGRNLALKHNVPLKLDISLYDNYPHHRYSLYPFKVQENFATKEEIASARRYEYRQGRRWFLYNALFADRSRFKKETQFNFDPTVFELGPNAYLDGYWQSERYFKDIEEIIREEFTLKVPLTQKTLEMQKAISETNAVSLHVRHGLYLQPKYNAHHGTSPLEYYAKAIDHIASHVPNPHFFIFSDDRPWVREHITLPFPTTYVEHTDTLTDYEDLYLMSNCKHHILANSTFSWWGAWLDKSPDKIVIGPAKWFKGKNYDLSDLLPSSWLRM